MTRFGTQGNLGAAALLLASTSLASAGGGVERNPQTTAMLFEEGTYVELGYSFVSPDVSGVQIIAAGGASPLGSASGDVAPSYSYSSLAFRSDITDELSFAVIIDEPIGASVDYAGLGLSPGYLYRLGTGSTAELSSSQLTVAARYEMPTGFSVYGGLARRDFRGSGRAFHRFPAAAGPATTRWMPKPSTEIGYMIGAAYERPDIAFACGPDLFQRDVA